MTDAEFLERCIELAELPLPQHGVGWPSVAWSIVYRIMGEGA
jgi:hypothetical protein